MNLKRQTIGEICAYRIDAADKITHISDNWLAFAVENAATDTCLPPAIYGSLIWDHIQGAETAHLYRLMVKKIRATMNPIQVTINCDAPDLKRHMRVTMQPGPEGEVVFESKIVGLEPRKAVDLLDASHPRSEDLVRICSYCKMIDLGDGDWEATETAVMQMDLFKYTHLPRLTHTICPGCYQSVMEEIEDL